MKVTTLFKTEGLGYTTAQIADRLNISQDAVRKIEKRALQKLSSPTLKDRWLKIIDTVNEISRNRVCML